MIFDIVIADCPWRYNQKGRGAAENHYPTMSEKDIKALGPLIQEVCNPKGTILLMWGTWPHNRLCLDVMDAWGLPQVTCAFNYLKVMKHVAGFKMNGGLAGTRANSEYCMLGRAKTRWHPPRRSNAVRQVIFEGKWTKGKDGIYLPDCADEPITVAAPLGRHSQKPAIFYDCVRDLYKGHRILELFGREKRKCIYSIGNELGGTDIVKDLRKLARIKR